MILDDLFALPVAVAGGILDGLSVPQKRKRDLEASDLALKARTVVALEKLVECKREIQ